jgi:hypothetical protein
VTVSNIRSTSVEAPMLSVLSTISVTLLILLLGSLRIGTDWQVGIERVGSKVAAFRKID